MIEPSCRVTSPDRRRAPGSAHRFHLGSSHPELADRSDHQPAGEFRLSSAKPCDRAATCRILSRSRGSGRRTPAASPAPTKSRHPITGQHDAVIRTKSDGDLSAYITQTTSRLVNVTFRLRQLTRFDLRENSHFVFGHTRAHRTARPSRPQPPGRRLRAPRARRRRQGSPPLFRAT